MAPAVLFCPPSPTHQILAARSRIARCIAILLIGLVLVPTPSWGEQNSGMYRGLTVSKVRVEGLESSLANELRDGLALTERSGFIRRKGISFEPGILEQDLERARLFLARRGYPYAEIETELLPSDDSKKLEVTLLINPGSPVIIDALEFESVGQARPFTHDEEVDLGIAAGSVFSDLVAERARLAVLTHLQEQSHAHAQVEVAVEALDETRVAVRFTGDPGPEFRFGAVKVSGVPESFHAVVNRAANIKRGEPYHPRTVRDATDDIRALRLFRKVDVSLVEADSTTLDFVCVLSERDHRSIEAGIGYMTDDGLLVTAGWEHRNLFKAGRGFRVFGSATQYRQLLESSVIFPAMFHSPTTGIGSVAYERDVEPAYESTDIRTSFFLTWRYNRRGAITGGPLLQIIDVVETADDPDVPQEISEADGLVTSLIADWTYDDSNDLIYPTAGFKLIWDHQLAPPGLGSVTRFYKMGVGGTVFREVRRRMILAGRVYAGSGWAFDGSEALLINYRYFAGGSNSHRGYQRHRLGPKDDNDNPQGGELTALTAVEVRLPFWRIIEATLFLDGGQVWGDKNDASFGEFSWAFGPGLAIRSPVGPIRFDYGIRINPPDDGEPNQVFHFAIGYAF